MVSLQTKWNMIFIVMEPIYLKKKNVMIGDIFHKIILNISFDSE